LKYLFNLKYLNKSSNRDRSEGLLTLIKILIELQLLIHIKHYKQQMIKHILLKFFQQRMYLG